MMKWMYEWCFIGKKMEHRCQCEQHIFEFTGKVAPVILQQFTGITVWKWLKKTSCFLMVSPKGNM